MISRRKASVKNASVAFTAQLIKMVGQFIVQTVFVHTLGSEFLGANGLFNNLITFLSFAELGIGAAFSYALYAPLAKQDKKQTTAIINLYKQVYNIIGLGILVVGLVLSYFVPFLTKSSAGLPHLRIYFVLYLLSAVVSYFFTYNRSLLIADQRGYVDSKNQLYFSIIKYVFQLFFLILFNSYFGFLIVQILSNLLSNILITRLTYKQYPYLKTNRNEKIDKSIVDKIKRNVIGTISSKIGFIVVTGTDNILISKFVSLVAVGFYSNYSLIITGITTVLNQVLNAVVASFGNLGVTEKNNIQKQINLFNQFVFVNAFAVFFIGLFLFGVFQPFVTLWLGSKYVLEDTTVLLIVVNFVLALFRPALFLINAYGLFWGYRYKSIVEAIVNFGLSFILVNYTKLGINGVLLGTIMGNILVNSWWDPLILFGGAYHRGISKFYGKYWSYMGAFLIILACEWYLKIKNVVLINNFIQLIIYAIILAIVLMVILIILFCRTSGERFFIKRFNDFLNRKI